MRVAIVGSGALGCLFAFRLAPLVPVTLIGHWEPQMAALQQQGLALEEPDGRRHQIGPGDLNVTTEATAAHPADVVLVLVKSYQTERAAAEAAVALAPDGLALTLQNGLGNLELLAAAVGSRRAAAGTTSEGATLVQPGLVRHGGRGLTYLGAGNARQRPRVAALAALLTEAGFTAHLSEDVQGLLWAKVAVNAGINPLTALLGKPNGFLVENAAARILMLQAAGEAAAVAAALGHRLPFPDAGDRTLQVARNTAGNRSSMLQDVQNGRLTEVEAITGAVVARGAELGVATPVNAALLALMRAMQEEVTDVTITA